ncbi:uncharacterized protein LOC118742501 isoform X2 [Rhagoletis pomonella]|uniref:uncharacterized protein LOC118742501 isoform X2 n=1 Tax=Rhagoletis pomonella TaxID=28610 RepID=UPI0017866564|nr:uncharacterized protein LOC118742501 isoform X2 [Rhagoletis pomonella]
MVLDTSADNAFPFSMNVPAFNCSEEARLLTETPLTELSSETRIKLSEMLNARKILRHAGHDRDWRGIAEMAKIRNFCNTNSDDPMQTVLSQWCQRNASEATCFHLLHFLSKIDRWDVSDDIFNFLIKDARLYEIKRLYTNATGGANDENITIAGNEEANNRNYDHDNETDEDDDNNGTDNDANTDGGSSSSLSPPSSRPPSPPNLESLIERVEVLANANNARARIPTPTPDPPRQAASSVSLPPKELHTETFVDEINPLTRQDAARLRRGLPLTKYDAFVLYAEPDQHYANEMQQKLEKYTEFNFELVFKNRDLLGGTFFHDAVTELMEERCKYVLLIITQHFSKDFESCFFFNNVQSLQLNENRRRIIPLLYDLHLPRALRGLHTLKYRSEHFWDLLTDSLSVEVPPLLIKVTEHKNTNAALGNLPKPPDSPIAVEEQKVKNKTETDKQAGKKKFLKKPDWIKKKKVQK